MSVDGDGMVLDIGAVLRSRAVLEMQLLEHHNVTIDDGTRARLARVWRQALVNVGSAVSPDLLTELSELVAVSMDDMPSPPELRLLEAQLLGWLDGVLASADVAVADIAPYRRESNPSSKDRTARAK